MTERLRSIDVVRGLAACAVVLYHATGSFALGAAGVDFFFIVSGFVMVGAAKGRGALQFLAARVWRVYPIYWIALLPWLVWAAMRGPVSGSDVAGNVLLWPLWIGTAAPLLYLAWTLVFECLFYAAAAVTIRLRSAVLPVAVFVAAAGLWGAGVSSRLLWVGNPIILEFLLGVLIAHLPKNETAGLRCLGVGVICFVLAASASASTEFQHFWPALTRVALWGVPAALIIYGMVSLERRFSGRMVGSLCLLGSASYSIYLFHPLITDVLIAPAAVKLMAGIALGVAAWMLFERPLLKLQRASWRPWKDKARPELIRTGP